MVRMGAESEAGRSFPAGGRINDGTRGGVSKRLRVGALLDKTFDEGGYFVWEKIERRGLFASLFELYTNSRAYRRCKLVISDLLSDLSFGFSNIRYDRRFDLSRRWSWLGLFDAQGS